MLTFLLVPYAMFSWRFTGFKYVSYAILSLRFARLASYVMFSLRSTGHGHTSVAGIPAMSLDFVTLIVS